jgi:spore coat polysaccharide biosynthesis protein SpsF
MRDTIHQEDFWKGVFGNEYTTRNNKASLVSSNISFFTKVLDSIKSEKIDSIIEYGSNVGLNLIALHCLVPAAKLCGVEINEQAYQELQKLEYVQSYNESLYDFCPLNTFDLVLIKGVLIHQPPHMLDNVYDLLYKSSNKYILLSEYYNPTPVEVEYRGNKSVLFKRDFCGEMLDRFSDLKLVNYGFVYHRDPLFPQDDMTWFLLRK